jgi:hypothetical protein
MSMDSNASPQRGFAGATLETIDTAAAKLAVAPDALRARCRRAARTVGNQIEANLGGGIVAFKFGRSWRVRFP